MKNVVMITGGGRGIGRAIASRLSETGNYSIAITYNTNEEKALEVVAELRKRGAESLAIKMSLEQPRSISFAVSEIKRKLGEVTVLVNNAGLSQPQSFEKIKHRDWDRMLAINLRGPFLCAQECLPGMLKNSWGRIINITSVGGQRGGIRQVHYAAAKAGVINLTKSIARLYSNKGITANSVAVGLVRTDMSKIELDLIGEDELTKEIPSGKIGDPKDVAGVVAFLAQEEASYITGQTVNVNGGMFLG